VLLCVAVCCSVLQCVAVCCSVLQCVAVTHDCISMSHDLYKFSHSAHGIIEKKNTQRLHMTVSWVVSIESHTTHTHTLHRSESYLIYTMISYTLSRERVMAHIDESYYIHTQTHSQTHTRHRSE